MSLRAFYPEGKPGRRRSEAMPPAAYCMTGLASPRTSPATTPTASAGPLSPGG
jgi:hypothetical protein